MSGARPYRPAEDALIEDACAHKRADRIRALAFDLGRSETGVRRRWQRLCGVRLAADDTAALATILASQTDAR